MAVNAEAVRQIVRQELEQVVAEVRELVEKVDALGEVTRGRALGVEEAAEYLGGLPVTTVQKLARNREIGSMKVGRTTVFPIPALNDYIEKHTLPPIDNPWGLTDRALRTVREGSPRDRLALRDEAMRRLFPRK